MKRKYLLFCLWGALFLATNQVQLALAQEHPQAHPLAATHSLQTEEGSHADHKQNKHDLTAKQWAFKFINFGVFLLIIYLTAGKQLRTFLKNNRQTIQTNISEAEEAQTQARQHLISAQEKLYQLENTKAELLAKFQKEAELEKEYLQAALKEQMSRMEQEFQLQMQLAFKKNQADLTKKLVDIAIAQARLFIEKNLNTNDQRNLLLQTITALETSPPAAFTEKGAHLVESPPIGGLS